MSTTRKLTGPVDCLLAIPEMLGYEPAESLVILPLAERRGRAILRVDLPPPACEPGLFAEAMLGHLARLRDCTRIVIAVFTNLSLEVGPMPAREPVLALIDAAQSAGIEVVDAVCRGGDAWAQYVGPLGGSRWGLRCASEHAPAANFHEFAQIVPRSRRARTAFAKQLAQLGDGTIPSDEEALEAWRDLLDVAAADGEDELPAVALTTARITVTAALRSMRLSELLLAEAAFGADAAVDLSLVWNALLDDFEASAIDGVLSDRAEFEPIDLDRTAIAILALRDLIALIPDADGANALAALSWLEWVRGGTSLAEHYSALALALDSDQLLGGVVHWLVANAILPGWFGAVGCEGGFRDEDFDALLEGRRS